MGTIQGNWRVVKPIGRGGTSEVYLLESQQTGKSAALKILLPEKLDDKTCRKAFTSEAGLLQNLDHKSIPRLIKETELDNRPALIMNHCDGENLVLLQQRRQKYPCVQALLAASKIIVYLHQQNIVHNDIKLSNFILSPKGRLWLIDFGNAKKQVFQPPFSVKYYRVARNKAPQPISPQSWSKESRQQPKAMFMP